MASLKTTVIAQNVEIETEVDFDGWFNYEAVDPETIGQFTGLTDMNDTKVFEGDILANRRTGALSGIIVFHKGSFMIRWLSRTTQELRQFEQEVINSAKAYWVAGNIHDDSKLLEKLKTSF